MVRSLRDRFLGTINFVVLCGAGVNVSHYQIEYLSPGSEPWKGSYRCLSAPAAIPYVYEASYFRRSFAPAAIPFVYGNGLLYPSHPHWWVVFFQMAVGVILINVFVFVILLVFCSRETAPPAPAVARAPTPPVPAPARAGVGASSGLAAVVTQSRPVASGPNRNRNPTTSSR